jgi:hypothetical protein
MTSGFDKAQSSDKSLRIRHINIELHFIFSYMQLAITNRFKIILVFLIIYGCGLRFNLIM